VLKKREPKNGGFSQRLCAIGKSSSRLKKCGFHDLELYPPNIDPAIPCHPPIQSFGKIYFPSKVGENLRISHETLGISRIFSARSCGKI